MKNLYFLLTFFVMVGYSSSAQLVINEVHYDPASGLDGDANNDGTRSANEDEFIEIYNSGSELDISGYQIFDDEALSNGTPRHIFPTGTVVPTDAFVVVFGGGSPTGSFGGAIVQTSSESVLNLNNSGDLITVQDNSGNDVVTFDIEPLSNNPDESYTRNPDLTGAFEQHAGIAEANGALFSPGTLLDGNVLSINDINQPKLSLFPNPVSQNQVTIETAIAGAKHIELYDINGRRVLKQTITANTVELGQLPQGLYVVRLNIGNRIQTSKLIIE